jgi:uncharacterized membrane protein
VKTILLAILGFALFGFLAAFWFATPTIGADGGAPPATPPPAGKAAAATTTSKFELIGVKKCAMCHQAENTGAQFKQWQTTAHSKAYATLAGDKAKAIAAERKLDKPPQESPQCLKCHVTAFPVMDKLVAGKVTLEEGVSCESCHGPGSGYWKIATMKAITAGTQDPKAVGLVMPTAEVCQRCHNAESPTFKEFKFAEMAAKIAHPNPMHAKKP